MNYWHLLAMSTVLFWGTSFISTKILLNHDFSAVQIFNIRFIITYLILLIFSHKQFFCKKFKDELLLVICGITGCTIYFWTENTALMYSPSSNVSLIVGANPLMIMIFSAIIYKSERLCKRQVLGCLITFLGMILVVLNGKFILKHSPLGDFFAFASACVWVVYSLVIRLLDGKYSMLFITRKVFFYGTITSIPILVWEWFNASSALAKQNFLGIPWQDFSDPVILINILALTVLSSLFGYLIWNKVLEQIGTVLASNYIYAVPLVTIITAVIVLDEKITLMAIAGAIAIITGMILAEWKPRKH